MASRNRPKHAGVRGKSEKTHYASGLTEIASETVRLWRKHHLGYDQTKYVVEQARRRLKLQSPGTRRRTVNRLYKSEVERLIRSTYQSHNKYGRLCGFHPGGAEHDIPVAMPTFRYLSAVDE